MNRAILTRHLRQAKARRELPPAELCRKIRDDAQLTQEELAEALGVSRVAVSRWENGRRRPRGQTLVDYLQALEDIAEASA